jgi:hypothetical protein
MNKKKRRLGVTDARNGRNSEGKEVVYPFQPTITRKTVQSLSTTVHLQSFASPTAHQLSESHNLETSNASVTRQLQHNSLQVSWIPPQVFLMHLKCFSFSDFEKSRLENMANNEAKLKELFKNHHMDMLPKKRTVPPPRSHKQSKPRSITAASRGSERLKAASSQQPNDAEFKLTDLSSISKETAGDHTEVGDLLLLKNSLIVDTSIVMPSKFDLKTLHSEAKPEDLSAGRRVWVMDEIAPCDKRKAIFSGVISGLTRIEMGEKEWEIMFDFGYYYPVWSIFLSLDELKSQPVLSVSQKALRLRLQPRDVTYRRFLSTFIFHTFIRNVRPHTTAFL